MTRMKLIWSALNTAADEVAPPITAMAETVWAQKKQRHSQFKF